MSTKLPDSDLPKKKESFISGAKKNISPTPEIKQPLTFLKQQLTQKIREKNAQEVQETQKILEQAAKDLSQAVREISVAPKAKPKA